MLNNVDDVDDVDGVGDAGELLELCQPFNVVSLVGLNKSAGKSTVLAKLIRAYHDAGRSSPLAVTSVGRGGALPEIRLFTGMYAATAAGALKDCDFTRRILHTSGVPTPLGEVVVTEALTDGKVSLAGPSIASQLHALCEYMRELGAGQVFVDGAGDRRTFVDPTAGAILCVGAGISRDVNTAARQCAHMCRLMTLPVATNCTNSHKVSGALTDDILAEHNSDALTVVDSSKIFLSFELLERFFHKGGQIFVEKPTNLIAVTINPTAPTYTFDRNEFIAAVKGRIHVPVFDVLAREII